MPSAVELSVGRDWCQVAGDVGNQPTTGVWIGQYFVCFECLEAVRTGRLAALIHRQAVPRAS